jgi:peptide/nickel transport system substrate-binding protein
MIKRTLRSLLIAPLVLLAGCAGIPAAPSATPPPLTPTTPAALPTAAALSPVPRNRTVLLGWQIDPTNIGVTNPVNKTYDGQAGNNLLWEGLAYYAIFADKEIPWLAQSMDYTKADFTELTIKLNPLARWSDGQLVTAEDVLFTFQVQRDHDTQNYHDSVQQFVQSFKAVDDHTVVLTFKIPAPRFKFEVLTLKFDTGLPILPAHVLSKQADVAGFVGGLDLVHSGPYNLVYWDNNRKVYDLRSDWWAGRPA